MAKIAFYGILDRRIIAEDGLTKECPHQLWPSILVSDMAGVVMVARSQCVNIAQFYAFSGYQLDCHDGIVGIRWHAVRGRPTGREVVSVNEV